MFEPAQCGLAPLDDDIGGDGGGRFEAANLLDLLLGTVLVRQEDCRIDDIAILILGGRSMIKKNISE